MLLTVGSQHPYLLTVNPYDTVRLRHYVPAVEQSQSSVSVVGQKGKPRAPSVKHS
jgi:hypothetical protein